MVVSMLELERLVLVVVEEVPIGVNGVMWEAGARSSLALLGDVRPSSAKVRGDRGVIGGPGSQSVGVGRGIGVVGIETGVVGGFDESGMGRVTPNAVAYCARESWQFFSTLLSTMESGVGFTMFLVGAMAENIVERSLDENHDRRIASASDWGHGFFRKRRVLRIVDLL